MGSMLFVFLASLTLSDCVERFPRQLPGIEEAKQFRWGKRHVLLMNENGTVEVKRSRGHNCETCKVELKSVCETHNLSVCPKSITENRVKIAATVMTMKFTRAGKYLCLHQNKTFYAVEHTDNRNVKECAFYIVQEPPHSAYTSIYHFKYPRRKKKRDRRLKLRRTKAAATTSYKFYLRKGNGDILTVTRQKSFKESRWLLHGKERF